MGEVPVADSDQPLVRVQFRALGTSSRVRWDFGDGQTSTQGDPMHIYLHPGFYTVKFSVPGEAAGLAIANRVEIGRAVVIPDRDHPPDQLAAYLPVLDGYDAATLDPPSLLQLVRAYDQAGRVSEAARVSRAWLLAEPSRDEATAHTLAGIAGSMLRDRLADPAGALAVWQAAAKAVRREGGRRSARWRPPTSP